MDTDDSRTAAKPPGSRSRRVTDVWVNIKVCRERQLQGRSHRCSQRSNKLQILPEPLAGMGYASSFAYTKFAATTAHGRASETK